MTSETGSAAGWEEDRCSELVVLRQGGQPRCGAGGAAEGVEPGVQIQRRRDEESEAGVGGVAAFVVHDEAVAGSQPRHVGVPQVQHSQRLADLLLRIQHGEVLDGRVVDLDVNRLRAAFVWSQQSHWPTFGLRIPSVDLRRESRCRQKTGREHSHVFGHVCTDAAATAEDSSELTLRLSARRFYRFPTAALQAANRGTAPPTERHGLFKDVLYRGQYATRLRRTLVSHFFIIKKNITFQQK